ncbi:MAG: YncE family protein, partial [Candidatus Bathyarchaeota archaeon]|nr:YncE family protein [Candidatus Bathyarchaeota archaeon]
GVAYDSGKGEIYITNWGANTVSVISDSNHTVIATIPVGNNPRGVTYDSAKGEIYVANSDSSGNGTISIISDSTHTIVATVTVGSGPLNLAYDARKGEIFVTHGGTVSVISDSTHNVVATLSVHAGGPGIAYDSAKGLIFFSGTNGHNATVLAISDSAYNIVANLTLPGRGSSYDVVCNPARGELYVPDGVGAVYVISTASLQSVPVFIFAAILILATATCMVLIVFRKKLLQMLTRPKQGAPAS